MIIHKGVKLAKFFALIRKIRSLGRCVNPTLRNLHLPATHSNLPSTLRYIGKSCNKYHPDNDARSCRWLIQLAGEAVWPMNVARFRSGASARPDNLIAGSEVGQGFCRCANGSYVRYLAGRGEAPVQPVSPHLGVLSWPGDAGRPGDKYPSDIMDGVCIRPHGGTNPIRFGSAGAHT